jgi:putative glutamine amidotransferase
VPRSPANVAFGGTLYQDLATQKPGGREHRVAALYDQNFHQIEFVAGTKLAALYRGTARATVNSVHHQGIRDLAPGFVVEAVAVDDGIIEAMRRPGPACSCGQWHRIPRPDQPGRAERDPILQDFLDATRIPEKSGV